MSVTTEEVQAHAADPALSAALASGDDVAAAARLSELLTEQCPIPIGRVAAWGAHFGVRAVLQDIADNTDHPLRSLALTTLDLLVRGDDLDLEADGALLDALVANGVVDTEAAAVLRAGAVRPRTVSASDVASAVRNGDGSSKL